MVVEGVMIMNRIRVLTSITGIALTTAVGAATPAMASPLPATAPSVQAPTSMPSVRLPAAAPSLQTLTWKWSDGSKSTERVFKKSDYQGLVSNLPTLGLRVYPAYPVRRAKLQFWVNGRWRTDDLQRTDAQGRLSVRFDPSDPDGKWFDLTWIARIKMQQVPREARQSTDVLVVTVRCRRA